MQTFVKTHNKIMNIIQLHASFNSDKRKQESKHTNTHTMLICRELAYWREKKLSKQANVHGHKKGESKYM